MINKIISSLSAKLPKKLKLKLNSFLYDHQKKIPATAGLLLLLGIFLTIGVLKSPGQLIANSGLNKIISTSVVSSGPDLKNLNFKNVERFEVLNSKATVIYVPQIHREPTSNPSDKKNDQALVVQKEIFSILETLLKDYHLKYIMDETDVYGPMPLDKVNKVQAGFSEIEKIRVDLKAVLDHYLKDGGSIQTANSVQKRADEKLNSFERNLYLTGGAAVFAAKDSKAHVYGSQNPETLKEAKSQLQNIVYMEQRINQLETKNGTSRTGAGLISPASLNNQSVANILSNLGKSRDNNRSSLQPIINFAKKSNNTELLGEINKVSNESKNFSSSRSYETTSINSGASVNKASVNPYQNTTNLSKLKQDYKIAYDKFIKLAKDQRSQEVSDNVDRMMEENNQRVSVLVLGKDHKDQIISNLNKKDINVIVITPESLK